MDKHYFQHGNFFILIKHIYIAYIMYILYIQEYDTDELVVDIISSNTHSVVNLVSPWVHRKKEEILTWGKKTHPEIVEVKKN